VKKNISYKSETPEIITSLPGMQMQPHFGVVSENFGNGVYVLHWDNLNVKMLSSKYQNHSEPICLTKEASQAITLSIFIENNKELEVVCYSVENNEEYGRVALIVVTRPKSQK
jgi:hypothetical protein